MDGQRFDDLTKVLATTSRRQVVKALAGGVASGLLALLSGQEAGAASCRGQPDFTPCGECKHCRNGRCVAGFDGLNCRTCGTCQNGRCRGDDRRCGECQRCRGHGRRCVPDPRQDLHPCGNDCHVCDGATGACTPLDDGSACLDRDGTCCGGICRDTQNDNANCGGCGNTCPRCWRCEGEQCVPDTNADGQSCPGPNSCGSCFNGECLVDILRCPDPCTTCDEANLTCVPRPEGSACGGECGICQHGQCLPQGTRCVERYGTCSSCDAETLTCTIDPDGTPCGSDSGDLECNSCQRGACVPVPDGEACGECGTCLGGTCINGPCQCSGFQDGCKPFEICQDGRCVAVCLDTGSGEGVHNGTFYACQTEDGIRCGCNGCDAFCRHDAGFACCTDGCQYVVTTCAQEGH